MKLHTIESDHFCHTCTVYFDCFDLGEKVPEDIAEALKGKWVIHESIPSEQTNFPETWVKQSSSDSDGSVRDESDHTSILSLKATDLKEHVHSRWLHNCRLRRENNNTKICSDCDTRSTHVAGAVFSNMTLLRNAHNQERTGKHIVGDKKVKDRHRYETISNMNVVGNERQNARFISKEIFQKLCPACATSFKWELNKYHALSIKLLSKFHPLEHSECKYPPQCPSNNQPVSYKKYQDRGICDSLKGNKTQKPRLSSIAQSKAEEVHVHTNAPSDRGADWNCNAISSRQDPSTEILQRRPGEQLTPYDQREQFLLH